MSSTVTVKFGEVAKEFPLFENRVHVPTIEKAFALRAAEIDGALAPADSDGFSHAKYTPGDTLDIDGFSSRYILPHENDSK